jgi:hypothetical protein
MGTGAFVEHGEWWLDQCSRGDSGSEAEFCGTLSEAQVIDPGGWVLRMEAQREMEAAVLFPVAGRKPVCVCRHLGQVGERWSLDNFLRHHHYHADELLAEIHDRMPVILADEDQEAWLQTDADPRELKALLAPYPARAMKSFQVSKKVNSALVDEPRLIEPIELQPELRLF